MANNNESSSNLQNFNTSSVGVGLASTYSTPFALNNYLMPNKPCTSSISSSSKSAIMSSNSQTSSSGQNLTLTSRDWFSYLYKIENIEDLIKPSTNTNETTLPNNFVQSPIFSFTNHLTYSNSTNNNLNSNNQSNNNSALMNLNASSSSSSSSISNSLTSLNKTIENLGGSSSSTSNNMNNSTNSEQNTNSNNKVKSSNWRLIFYPNGAGADCKNFLSIFLKYLSDEPVKIQMMFSIVDNNNQDIYVKYTVNKFQKSNDWGFKQLIHKNAILYQKEKFLKPYNGGTLSVRVRMRLEEQKNDHIKQLNENLHYSKLLSENFSQYYYNQQQNSSSESNETNDSNSLKSENISNQVSQLSETIHFKATNLFTTKSNNETNTSSNFYEHNFNNHLYHDLILLVKSDNNNEEDVSIKQNSNNKRSINEESSYSNSNKKFKSDHSNSMIKINNEHFIEIRAHKCILAARSPVFKAMFNYRLKENLTNKLIIEDCKSDVIKAMLKYIYTAQIPDDMIKPIAIDLYIAAEKYFIESLKIKCREYLAENLTSDSVIHTFILSELYNDSMLRKQSLKFISENIEKVTQNSEWNEFMVAYPQYFTNAFIRLCKKDF